MKKIFFTITALIISCGVFAQTESLNTKANPDKTVEQQHRHPNGYMMKDGKLMLVKDGNLTLVQKDITLSNGTIISADGTYLEKGKTKTKFKDGQHIDFNGHWLTMPTSKSK